MIKIKRALLSVSDKTGIVDLGKVLVEFGTEIVSTGGTAKVLREAGVPVREVSEVTSFPEMLAGRVKTLHPKIFAGILYRRSLSKDSQEIANEGIKPIDLVAVNLYPFEKVVSQKDVDQQEAIENIDIGGPSLLRAAAKNSSDVVVLSDPSQYPLVIDTLRKNKGQIPKEMALELGRAVFAQTAIYDAVISLYLNKERKVTEFPKKILLVLEKVAGLRYGENPHQKASLYREKGFWPQPSGLLTEAEKLQGKELSFNNYLDLEAAYGLAREFDQEAAVIVKHNNPCGVALGPNILTAFRKAKSCDPVSAFGGIVALNRPVDEETASEITTGFVECVLAPEYSKKALEVFHKKPDIRLLQVRWTKSISGYDLRKISGGYLVQERDDSLFTELQVVSQQLPEVAQLEDLKFAFVVAKHTKSNAIVLAKDGQTIGIGAGQMSRLDSSRIAISKAKEFGFQIKGALAASDAFFPFPDALEVLAKEGVSGVIHPGGSKKDQEVLATADRYGMVMVLTGQRHFRH